MKIKYDYIVASGIFLALTYWCSLMFLENGIIIYLIAQGVLMMVALGLFRKGFK